MHSKNDIIQVMIFDKADDVIEEIFEPSFSIYQIGLELSMKGSHFVFDCGNVLYYKCN